MTDQKQTPDLTAYQISDPEAFAQNLLKVFEEGGKLVSEYWQRADGKASPYSTASEVNEATNTVTEITQKWLANPQKFSEAQADLLQDYIELWNRQILRLSGEEVEPLAEPDPGDNRFKDPEWSQNPFFDFWKQAYLLTSNWAERVLNETEGLDEHARQKAEFYFRQVSSALSPSNVPVLNPEILRETLSSNAHNLVQGLSHLNDDMQKSGDLLKISQTDTQSFEVGKNLATTPGKVVFQNDLLQLIQYTPTTEQVHETPLMMVPPWINKFYVLDLNPQKSFIKYAVDQGFTVFVVSWVNPDTSLSHKTFEDYMIEGLLTAADAVTRETNVEQINVLGYCVGGTLLGTTLAYLAQRGEEPFKSVTFLTTQVDFEKAGDLLLFTEDGQLNALEKMMTERGFLDGSRMANVFNMMRPRDLIWPYIVNNYLLGKKPFPFDLLYWNQDSTRMAAANHAFYLREFYNENNLAEGRMTLAGTKLDLSKVKLPMFELATKEDHIAPAVSVFKGAKLFGGKVDFVLAGSGHIAGVVNPPEKVKYQYWTHPADGKPTEDTLEDWMANATENPGSWWPLWSKWLTEKSGPLIAPRKPGANLGLIEDAPGSYVKSKS